MTSASPETTAPGTALQVRAGMLPRSDEILTPDALDLVAELLVREGGDERAWQRLAAAQQGFEATRLVTDRPQPSTGYAYEHFLVDKTASRAEDAAVRA